MNVYWYYIKNSHIRIYIIERGYLREIGGPIHSMLKERKKKALKIKAFIID